MTAKHRRKPYMPDSDDGKKLWMERFITQVEKDPERYGFTDPRMFEYYRRTIRRFIDAVKAVQSPATCTPGAVRQKNNARKDAVRMCRDFAMQFKWDTSFSDAEKRSLGIITKEAPPEEAKLGEGDAGVSGVGGAEFAEWRACDSILRCHDADEGQAQGRVAFPVVRRDRREAEHAPHARAIAGRVHQAAV